MIPGMPGMDPRRMKVLQKQLGMRELEAEEVIIRLADKELVISNPSVTSMKVMGQTMFQVAGEAEEISREEKPLEITDEDIRMVVEQAGVSKEKASEALKETKGDIAEAIMKARK